MKTTEQRIEQLEQRNRALEKLCRQMKRLFFYLTILITILFGLAVADALLSDPETVEASRLIIKDPNSKAQMELTAKELAFRDKKGAGRVSLAVPGSDPCLVFNDENGTKRLLLASELMALFDESGNTGCSMLLGKDGPELELRTKENLVFKAP